jgi:acyl-coenzyme A thioesterase PaaI-like protein
MTSADAILSDSGTLAAKAAAERRAFAPAHARFGVLLREVWAGGCVATMPAVPATDAAGRFVLAGSLVLVDAVLGMAIGSALPAGSRITTLHLRVSTSGARPVGPVLTARAAGPGVRAGSNAALSTGVVEDAEGTEIAAISTRCAVLSGTPGSLSAPAVPALPVAESAAEALNVVVEEEVDRCTAVRGTAHPDLANNLQRVQGGVLGALAELALDRALTRAARSAAGRVRPVGQVVPAPAAGDPVRDLELVYLSGVVSDGTPMWCRALVQHAGRRFATGRAELVDVAGRLAVTATATRYAG